MTRHKQSALFFALKEYFLLRLPEGLQLRTSIKLTNRLRAQLGTSAQQL